MCSHCQHEGADIVVGRMKSRTLIHPPQLLQEAASKAVKRHLRARGSSAEPDVTTLGPAAAATRFVTCFAALKRVCVATSALDPLCAAAAPLQTPPLATRSHDSASAPPQSPAQAFASADASSRQLWLWVRERESAEADASTRSGDRGAVAAALARELARVRRDAEADIDAVLGVRR